MSSASFPAQAVSIALHGSHKSSLHWRLPPVSGLPGQPPAALGTKCITSAHGLYVLPSASAFFLRFSSHFWWIPPPILPPHASSIACVCSLCWLARSFWFAFVTGSGAFGRE